MKILLAAVNAKYIHSNPALYGLRAYASEWKEYTEIVEYTINHLPEQILTDIYEHRPDVIAFSCYIWNWTIIRNLLRELPKILPKTAIWLGGPEVSFDAPDVLRNFPQLSGVMIGEGEETFAQLCQYYITGKGNLNEIAGLCLPETGYTAEREPIRLDAVPFFYEDLEVFRDRIIYYETSRGCPYSCSYCLSSVDRSVRFRSLEKVYRELDFFMEHQVPQVKFVDRTFNCNHEHCQAIWRYIKLHDNGITNFHFEIAGDLLTEEEILLLQSMRPGLIQLEIGVQTTNSKTLSAIRRKTNVKRIHEIVARLSEKKNIHIHLDLIAGLPEEDLQSFRKSFDEVYRMQCENLQLGFLKVLKGSYMKEQAKTYALQYLDEPPYEVLSTKWLKYDHLLELKRVERVLEMYHNTCQFEATLHQLEKETESPYELFLLLAEFYRARGFEQNQPSRLAKYQILLEFAVSRHPENESLYRELLTFDAYMREKCKQRPKFAMNLATYRDEIHRIQTDSSEHIEPFFYRVWEENPGTKSTEPYFLIFYYNHRNPLTHNAAFRVYGEEQINTIF